MVEVYARSDGSLHEWRVGGGVYSLHTKSNRYTQLTKLGGTESENSVIPIQFNMWTLGFSVGPTCQLGGTDSIRVKAQRNLGETDYTNSMGPILVIS